VTDLDLVGKLLALEAALATAGIPHAFGGAMALAAYVEPRGTDDLDLGVFTGSDEAEHLVSVLGSLGMDTEVDLEVIKSGDWGRLYWDETPVDFFFSYTPMHFEMQERVRQLSVSGSEVPVLGPEDVIGLKVVFNRPKDWVDIDNILQRHPDVDLEVVQRWILTMFDDPDNGPHDRTVRVNDLARRHGLRPIDMPKAPRRGLLGRLRRSAHKSDAAELNDTPQVRTRPRTPLGGRQGRRPVGTPAGGQLTPVHRPEAEGIELVDDDVRGDP
jgi:hypothetical protein